MSIEFKGVKIIDSYNFIPMALSKIPQTFGFKELQKGYFPHLFNSPDNQNKIFDCHPAVEYYGDKFMNSKDRESFLIWHEKQR
jgi:hypothetical protein